MPSPVSCSALLAALLPLLLLGRAAFGREQIAAVQGTLMCGQSPAHSVRVALYDEDVAPDPDDLLDQSFTDLNGEFVLKGSTSEDWNIEPVLKISHDCADEGKPGVRLVRLRIPYAYVTAPGAAERWFDLGALNLETGFEAEQRELQPAGGKHRRHHFPRRLNYDADLDMLDGF